MIFNRLKNIPINLKIGLILFLLGLILFFVLMLSIVPKMQKQQFNYTIKKIEQMVLLTQIQIDLATKYLKNQRNNKLSEAKKEIENILKIYDLKKLDKQDLIKEFEQLQMTYKCNFEFDSEISTNMWEEVSDENPTMCPIDKSNLVYKTDVNGESVKVNCKIPIYKNGFNIEENIKEIIQKGFSLTKDIHGGKIYLMWVNKNDKKNYNEVFTKLENQNYYNYCISRISNLTSPNTGDLTLGEILNAKDSIAIKHKIDNENTLTWLSNIYEDDTKKFLLVVSVYEKDITNYQDSVFWKIFPIVITSLLFTIILGFFVFKKMFKSIEILSQSARKITQGETYIRCNIKGDDDIGVLGVAFDSMLNKLENNIFELDKKVNERTKELKISLEEKEILLKEIHHRVKNNLSLTIYFLKIQKTKVQDETTKNVLIDLENKIYTMALLHTKLYETKDLKSIEISKYIKELINDIIASYSNDENEINIIFDVEELYFDIDSSLALGIIINEIVTNACKYAFEKENNTLEISLKKIDETYYLKIYDSGKGLPKDFDLKSSKSFGLKLVKTIVNNQLQGEINYYYEKGSNFEISFSL